MCGLMVKLCLIQYLNGVLVTLKLIYQIKATPWITGLYLKKAHILSGLWHLDVGLSFPKFRPILLVGLLVP